MNYIISIICSMFVFLGMYIGKKRELKYFSINSIFGLFIVNGLFNIITCINILSKNYHDTTIIYTALGIILGYILMKIISTKNDKIDDISIAGFSIINSYLLIISKFSIISLIINIIYYILLGIYVKDSKSYISIIVGTIIGIIISIITSWIIGYIFSIIIGVLIYFLYSIYNVVTHRKDNIALIGLIVGLLIGVVGALWNIINIPWIWHY